MSNELIRNYFSINPHFRIEWINDSSCNLVFPSNQEADSAVMPLVVGEGMKDETDRNSFLTQCGTHCLTTKSKAQNVSSTAEGLPVQT